MSGPFFRQASYVWHMWPEVGYIYVPCFEKQLHMRTLSYSLTIHTAISASNPSTMLNVHTPQCQVGFRVVISMTLRKTAATPLLIHWSYCNLAPSHRYVPRINHTVHAFLCFVVVPVNITCPSWSLHWRWGNRATWEIVIFDTLRPIQNGRNFADDTFKHIFLKENVRISIKISLKFVPSLSPIDNIPALFQVMAWRRPGDKPLSEAMMVSLLTHICVTRPQWIKSTSHEYAHMCGVIILIIICNHEKTRVNKSH